MRWLTLVLVLLLALLQYPLWLGKGGWLKVWDYDRQLAEQKEANRRLEARNAGLDAEVRDLKQGYEAIEERARFELGMIRQDEVFVQVPDRGGNRPSADSSAVAEGLPAALPGVRGRPAVRDSGR
jgi:cell division protein FtsB